MPKGCGDCACYDVEWARCAFVNKSADDFDKRLEECPLVEDVAPIKHALWRSELVKKEDWKGNMQSYYQPISCSLCHAAHYEESRCCPHCGAKMDGKEEE